MMKELPNIQRFTTNLTDKVNAKPDEFTVIGRDTEVRKLSESLLRKTKNSPVLVGDPGVGKTAIVEGFVKKQLNHELPEKLNRTEVIELSIAALQGPDFLQNFENLIQELKENRNDYILFIDEVHMIMGAGDDNGSLDMGNLLKPSLARGEFMVISATTQDEYQTYIEGDSALERRLQRITVLEPTIDHSIDIMNGLRHGFESFYNLTISDEAVRDSVLLSKRYDSEHFLPDKAIDLLESTAARLMLQGKKQLDYIDVADQVEEQTGIPASSITKSNVERAMNLTQTLDQRVLGQPRATETVAHNVQKVLVKHNNPGKPLGSMFFLGPSGTGKTELAKAMAQVMFDDETNMLRFDMSEYKEESATSKFIERATANIRRNPYTIVLLDEMEKANKNVFDLILQILQDGMLTNSRNKTADFSNAYIIMTSNEGFKYIEDKETYEGIPTGQFGIRDSEIMHDIKEELQHRFRPEFVNRIDDIVLFSPLNKAAIKEITTLRMNEYVAMVKQQNNWEIKYSTAVIDYIADTAYDPSYGARPVARTIREKIDNILSYYILYEQIQEPQARFLADIEVVKDTTLGLQDGSRFDDRKIEIKLSKIL
ncbi:AAA family ATPase [Weissella minor]|uniref:AAA family ATPase n=1 Tax=Weissella minor TaxID=1620 RepID=UPI003AF2ACC5